MFEEKEKREREGKRGATLLLCVKWYKMASRFGWASQSARVPARGRSDGTTNNISTTLHYLLVATTRLVSSLLLSSVRTHARTLPLPPSRLRLVSSFYPLPARIERRAGIRAPAVYKIERRRRTITESNRPSDITSHHHFSSPWACLLLVLFPTSSRIFLLISNCILVECRKRPFLPPVIAATGRIILILFVFFLFMFTEFLLRQVVSRLLCVWFFSLGLSFRFHYTAEPWRRSTVVAASRSWPPSRAAFNNKQHNNNNNKSRWFRCSTVSILRHSPTQRWTLSTFSNRRWVDYNFFLFLFIQK